MNQTLKVLLLEDLPTDVELVSRQLRNAGLECEIACVADEASFVRGLDEFAPDLILSDFSLPLFDGLSALDIARARRPDIPYIFVSGTIGEERAIESMKRGATDYVLKSNLRRLPAAITRALNEARERAARMQAEQALRMTEERFRLLVNGVSDHAIFMLDPTGNLVSWNTGAERLMGYGENEVLGRPFGLFHCLVGASRTPPSPEEQLAQAAASGHFESEGLLTRKDGSRFWANVSITPLYEETPAVRGFAVVTRDITERKANEDKIARLSRIHAVLSGINAAIVRILDRQELFREACRIAVEHGNFGIAWIGQVDPDRMSVTMVAHAGIDAQWLLDVSNGSDSAQPAQGLVARAIEKRRAVYSNDLANEASEASPRRQEAMRRGYRSAIVLPLFSGERLVGSLALIAAEPGIFNEDEIKLLNQLAADISFALDHIEKEERLNYLAYYDALTDLPNRTLFNDRLGRLTHAHRPGEARVAVLYIDIPRFHLVNESFGRGAGDAVLQEMARRLAAVWPNEGSLARIGANAYAVMLVDTRDAAQVAHLLETSVARVVADPVRIVDQDHKLALACGIALFPDDATDPDELLRNAEAAANKAKSAGESYLFYEPDMNARVARTLRLENKLRRALDDDEFVLHYQPKLDLRTQRVVGLEALIRWNDPDGGLVPPLEFIPILEQTGMILDVGRWAIETAVREYARLHAEGVPCPRIAVNVSAVQLRRRDFVQEVEKAIAGSSSAAHGLDLEITESLAMENVADNIPKLQALHAMGIGVAIDDFGTGYSSLSYISRLPVAALKIDRSFIVNMTRGAEDMAIISTVIALAHDLRLKAIAEGVDSEEQALLLRQLGCDELQGYLLSRPIPIEQLGALLQRIEAQSR
jgi:diguanylate cyclase (GGDEF)-like protein/PAS domain S-box-containing protein